MVSSAIGSRLELWSGDGKSHPLTISFASGLVWGCLGFLFQSSGLFRVLLRIAERDAITLVLKRRFLRCMVLSTLQSRLESRGPAMA